MLRRVVLILLLLFLPGCFAKTTSIGQRVGPATLAPVEVESWSYQGKDAFRLTTPHYIVYTTFSDPEYANEVAQVLEAGFQQYKLIAPAVKTSDDKMFCYVFANRQEWADFTRRNTGAIANVYLQINRGGYTLRDWFVAFDLGPARTYSVSAHEGWHQYAFKNFVGRLPPFLEEGIACMFEDVELQNNLPRFNLSINRVRVQALRKALDHKKIFPLRELIRLHAGEVVGQSGEMIETFYAQNWAFAKFLWEGEGGRYRPALQKLIADTADGSVIDPTGSHRRSTAGWNPNAVAPLLERYLGMSLDELTERYYAYLIQVAYEEYKSQFES